MDYRDHVSSGMNSNTKLNIGDAIYSLNGNIRIKLGLKGQLILQQYINLDWQALWANNILAGTSAVLSIQYDGNLVVYASAGGIAKWGAASNNPDPPQHLVVSNNGYAYILNSKNEVMWSTGSTTNLPTFAPPTSAPISTPTSSCSGQFYAGPFGITDSNNIGTVRIGESTEISFMFKVNDPTWTCITGWCHILRIGPVDTGVQLPLIRINSLDQSLNVAYTGMQNYNENRLINSMFDGNEHSFYFKHTSTQNMFIYDGITLMNNTQISVNTEIGNVYNIWICDQITSNVFPTNGFIWDLCVHSMSTTTQPTTNIPTTNSPTTFNPTTTSPTTTSPTTINPTTINPTTFNPTTISPTTTSPTTKNPTTAIPTTFKPTSSLPTTYTPTSTTPTTSLPSTFNPTTDIPTTQQPVTAIPTTNIPTVFPSDSPTKNDDEQSVEDSKTTTIYVSFDNKESGIKSQGVTLTQQVIVIIAICTIIIIILFCLICIVIIILKKIKKKKIKNSNEKDVEMHRVLSFSQSPTTQGIQHITASTSMSGITPQMGRMSSKNNDINEGINMDDITTNLPVLSKENEINLDETEPDNVTKGGFINNDNTPIGDDVNDESGESDHDGLYKKPIHVVQTPQYYNENDLFDDDDEDDFYKKPVNQNTGTLH